MRRFITAALPLVNLIKMAQGDSGNAECFEELETPENGSIDCNREKTDSGYYPSSTVCTFFCNSGYSRLGSTSRKCKCKRNNCRWTGNSDQLCAKSYQKSPCLISEGGCAWKCIDRGDGIPNCLCPCRYKLTSDGQSCELDTDSFCPLQIDVLFDSPKRIELETGELETVSECRTRSQSEFISVKGEISSQLADHISTTYQSDFELTISASIFNRDGTTEVIQEYTEHISSFVDSINLYDTPNCASSQKLDVLAHLESENFKSLENSNAYHGDKTYVSVFVAFDDFSTGKSEEIEAWKNSTNSDGFMVLGSVSDVLSGRVTQLELEEVSGDSRIVYYDTPDFASPTWPGLTHVALADLLDRTACYSRVTYPQPSLVCNGFTVEVFIPSCRLDGLQPSDLYFQSEDSVVQDCTSFESHNSTHYKWVFGYDDCGMTVLTNETNPEYVKYRTWLKTHINLDGITYPYMPVIDMPLECTVFVEDESHSSIVSFDPNAHDFEVVLGTSKGNVKMSMQFYTDENYSQEILQYPHQVVVNDRIYIKTSAEIDEGYTMMLDKCVATESDSSGASWSEFLEDIGGEPYYYLIAEECPIDETLAFHESGLANERRFSFQTFSFTGHETDSHPVSVHCFYKICSSENSGNCVPERLINGDCLTADELKDEDLSGNGRRRRAADDVLYEGVQRRANFVL